MVNVCTLRKYLFRVCTIEKIAQAKEHHVELTAYQSRVEVRVYFSYGNGRLARHLGRRSREA
jgi:hypothetical protein